MFDTFSQCSICYTFWLLLVKRCRDICTGSVPCNRARFMCKVSRVVGKTTCLEGAELWAKQCREVWSILRPIYGKLPTTKLQPFVIHCNHFLIKSSHLIVPFYKSIWCHFTWIFTPYTRSVSTDVIPILLFSAGVETFPITGIIPYGYAIFVFTAIFLGILKCQKMLLLCIIAMFGILFCVACKKS